MIKHLFLLAALMLLGACNLPASAWVQPRQAPAAAPAQPQGQPVASRDERLPYCNSGIDCGHGQFCKDRGDGLKLCMGNGARGDYCSTGIDCASGMFCKNRGDGLKVCM